MGYTKHPNYPLTGDADESLLYNYRDPKRFQIGAEHVTKKKSSAPPPALIQEQARDIGIKQTQEDILRKQKIVRDASGGKALTVSNLAKSTGLPDNSSLKEVTKNMIPIDGFISDYEFQDSESYHSDFLEHTSNEAFFDDQDDNDAS